MHVEAMLPQYDSVQQLQVGCLSALSYPAAGLMLDVHDEALNTAKLKGKVQVLGAKVGEVDDQFWVVGDSVDPFINPYWKEYWQNAKDIGAPLVAYLFDNPQYKRAKGSYAWSNDEDPQIRVLRQAFSDCPPSMLAIDVERYWESYNQWYRFLAKEIADVDVIPEGWIVKSFTNLVQRIKEDQEAGKLPEFTIGIYTGPGFVNTYAPSLAPLLKDYVNWIATYPEDLAFKLSFLANIDDLRSKAWPVQGTEPLRIGSRSADIWQYGGNALFADCSVVDRNTKRPCSVDVSIVLNPALFSGISTPPEPPAVVEPVTTPFMAKTIKNVNVRTIPSTVSNQPVLVLPSGTEVEIVDTVKNQEGVWRCIKITKTYYVADNVRGTKFLDTPEL